MKKISEIRPVAAAALIAGAGVGVFSNAAGLFIEPVSTSMGFSRGGFGAVSTISLLFSMLMTLPFGRWLKTVSPKRIVILCSAVCCCVLWGYSFCGALWQFYLLAAVNGLAVNGITMLTASVMASKSKAHAKTAAVGAAAAGAGLFGFAAIPAISRVIESFGWRWGYRAQSAIGLAILLPTALLLVDSVPAGGCDKEKTAAKIGGPGFWALCAGLFLANFASMAQFNHAASFIRDMGFSPDSAAGVMSACTLITVAAKPLYGLLLDKAGLKIGVAALCLAILGSGAAALALPFESRLITVYPLLLAAGSCSNSILAAAFTLKLFGQEHFAPVVARLTLATTAATALATPLAGFVFDLTGGYNMMWWACISAGAISGALLFSALKRSKKM